jgi:hypothetical protein
MISRLSLLLAPKSKPPRGVGRAIRAGVAGYL